MLFFFLFLLCFLNISSEDYSVQVDGTISVSRFIVLSENTLSGQANGIDSSGDTTYLLGSIEVNLQNTSGSGGNAYLSNIEFDSANTLFRVVGLNGAMQQLKIKIESDTNITTGAAETTNISPADPALFRDTSSASDNERIILTFYAQDNAHNTSGAKFYGNFLFYWTD